MLRAQQYLGTLYFLLNFSESLELLKKKKNLLKQNWASLVAQWASLVAQWLRICLPMQGMRVRALVWEDPTCHGATRPVSHNY